ncbi:NAD(P)-binding protein [Thozetella sp. PMI_491]|nr:NAD(P)-binding protein [Thozetella sp. PMI_491]
MVPRTVLITGCSDGSLGAALALAFHKAGWRVIASARNTNKLQGSIAAGLETVLLDITSDESVAQAVDAVKELTGGPLDALVNNAGAGYSLPLLDVDIDKVRNLYELNVFSLIRTTRAFFPLLVKSPRGGLVVNNTSGMGLMNCAFPFQGSYASSKAAACSLTEVMRLELQPFGIRVVNLLTGSVKSTFFDNAPKATLPESSLYNVAKEQVEIAMSSEDQDNNGSDRAQWAAAVVRDLDRPNPPHWVSHGKNSTLARFTSLLPVGFMDGLMKKLSGLGAFEQKLKEQGGIGGLKVR